jgi:predicted peptidase
LDAFIAEHKVDPDRIYLTGLSRGGYGAWRLAMEDPDRFAAMVVISGAAPAPYAGWLQDLPIRVFHGDQDDDIPVEESQRIVTTLKARGADVELTVYPGVGHDAWTQTYADPAVWEWLFQHRRSDRP